MLATLRRIEQLSQELGKRDDLALCYRNLVALYRSQGKWPAVYDYQERYIALQAALHQQQTTSLNNLYELHLVEARLTHEYQEAALARTFEVSSDSKLVVILVLLVVCAILFVFAYPALKEFHRGTVALLESERQASNRQSGRDFFR